MINVLRRKAMWVKTLSISIFVMSMTGCGVKKFDCPYTDGVYCKSLREVNEMINNGERGKLPFKKKPKTQDAFFTPSKLAVNQTMPLGSSLESEPIRVPEKIVRIWLAPYESEEGIFHQETVINTVVAPAHWMGR
jgi:conjugal transfer pilus assembly protein TraV